MKKRIVGIDVARALAVIGMIIVNFKTVFGIHGDSWLNSVAHLFDGKAAATFVVLAGVGLALMSNSAIKHQDSAKLLNVRKRIFKKAMFLFVFGLSYILIWPADILHFYGVYMLITLLFLNRPLKQILLGSTLLIAIYPILVILVDYEAGWNFSNLTYLDFWSVRGFLRNLFYNGFHPVVPWSAFMLFGLWYGRHDLLDEKFLKISLLISLAVFISIQLLSIILIDTLASGNQEVLESLKPILGTDPMPPLPFYMINGISISIVIISSCILLAKRFHDSTVISALNKTGQLALTFYVAHVVIGIIAVDELGPLKLGEYSIQFSIIYSILFSLGCILFAQLWLKYIKQGPVEWIMRKLTD